MNIIFMGTPEFAVPSLEILASSHHNILAVVTTPDKPSGRGLKPSQSAVKKYALSRNLKVLQPDNLSDPSFTKEILELHPDLIIIVAFRVLPKEVFTIPKYGSVNLHASLLPKYRGAAPINWAIINGEKETGVTTFFLDEKVDTGNIITAEKCRINEDDDAGTLHDKLSVLGASAVMSTVNLIEMSNGQVPVYVQSEALFTKAPKIFKDFCRINWENTAYTLHNFIRGLSPYPAAFTEHNGKALKIFKSCAKPVPPVNGIPDAGNYGVVKIDNGKLLVSCTDGFIEILELQLEGKKRMTSEEFLRGYRLIDGDILGK